MPNIGGMRKKIYIKDPETGEMMSISEIGQKYCISRSTLQNRHKDGLRGWALVKPTNLDNKFKRENEKRPKVYKQPSVVRREALVFEFKTKMTKETEWLTKPITVKSGDGVKL